MQYGLLVETIWNGAAKHCVEKGKHCKKNRLCRGLDELSIYQRLSQVNFNQLDQPGGKSNSYQSF